MSGNTNTTQVVCYQLNNNKIQNFPGTPCGVATDEKPYIPCCQLGDTCLPEHFCYFTHSLTGASQFYVAPCTDPKHKDTSACTDQCGDLPVQDAVYNSNSQLWQCCNATNGVRQCPNPSDETFQADPPQKLLSLASATSSGFSASITATATPTGAVAAETTSAAPTASGGGLSTGQAAGVGVGAGIGGALLLGALAYMLWSIIRRRRRRERDEAARQSGPPGPPVELSNAQKQSSWDRKKAQEYKPVDRRGEEFYGDENGGRGGEGGGGGGGVGVLGHSKSRGELAGEPVGANSMMRSEMPGANPAVELEGDGQTASQQQYPPQQNGQYHQYPQQQQQQQQQQYYHQPLQPEGAGMHSSQHSARGYSPPAGGEGVRGSSMSPR